MTLKMTLKMRNRRHLEQISVFSYSNIMANFNNMELLLQHHRRRPDPDRIRISNISN